MVLEKYRQTDQEFPLWGRKKGTEPERTPGASILAVILFSLKLNSGHIGIFYTVTILICIPEVLAVQLQIYIPSKLDTMAYL